MIEKLMLLLNFSKKVLIFFVVPFVALLASLKAIVPSYYDDSLNLFEDLWLSLAAIPGYAFFIFALSLLIVLMALFFFVYINRLRKQLNETKLKMKAEQEKAEPIHIVSWKGYNEVTRTIGDTYHVVEYIKELVNIELLRLNGRHFQIAILDVERVYEINQKYSLEVLSSSPFIGEMKTKDPFPAIELLDGHDKLIKINLARFISKRLNQSDLLLHRRTQELLAIPIRWGFCEILYHNEAALMLRPNNTEGHNNAVTIDCLNWGQFELDSLEKKLCHQVQDGHVFKIVILDWFFPVLLQLFAARLQARLQTSRSDVLLKFPLNKTSLVTYLGGEYKEGEHITWISNEIREICDQIVKLKKEEFIEFCPNFEVLSKILSNDDGCCRIVFGAGGMVPHNKNYQSLSTAENGGFFWAECAALPQESHLKTPELKKEVVSKFVHYVGELLSTKNQMTLSGLVEVGTHNTYYAMPISQTAMNEIGKDSVLEKKFERQFGKVTSNDEALVTLRGLQCLSENNGVEQYLWPRQVLEDIDDNIKIKREWERIWEDKIVPVMSGK